MNVQRPVTPSITVADQPTEADLEALRAEGYVGVVNLRHPGEPEQPLDPEAEGALARQLGLDYLHHGIGGAPLSDPGVASVLDFIDAQSASGKVLVHCRKGGRAVALVLLQQARAQGWAADEALALGQSMGLTVEGNLRGMVEQYLAQQANK